MSVAVGVALHTLSSKSIRQRSLGSPAQHAPAAPTCRRRVAPPQTAAGGRADETEDHRIRRFVDAPVQQQATPTQFVRPAARAGCRPKVDSPYV